MGIAQREYEQALARLAGGADISNRKLERLADRADEEVRLGYVQEESARRQELLTAQVKAHLLVLKGLAKGGSVAKAEEALLFALSLVTAEEAGILGPRFAAAHFWVTAGEDEEGVFLHTDNLDVPPASAFFEEIQYREAIAKAVMGPELLSLALQPFTAEESSDMAISVNQKRDDLPPRFEQMDDFGRAFPVFVRWRKDQGALDFRTYQEGKFCQSFSLPCKTQLLSGWEVGTGVRRAQNTHAVDQHGEYFLVDNQLYRKDVQGLAKCGALDLGQFRDLRQGNEEPCLAEASGSKPSTQQLVSYKGKALLLATVKCAEERFEEVCIDLTSGTLLWHHPFKQEGWDCPIGWQFHEDNGCWYHRSSREVQVEQAKAGLLGKLFGATEQKTKREGLVIERDALTGQVRRTVQLVDDMYGHLGPDRPGRLILCSSDRVYAYLNLTDLSWEVPEVPEALDNELALHANDVGANRASFLEDVLRYPPRWLNGELGSPVFRLVRR